MLETGDRVIYVSGKHGYSSNNPLIGTRYECHGTVKRTDEGNGFPVQVLWDNGKSNSYSPTDLEFVTTDKTNPNIAFRIIKQNKRK